MDQKPKDHKNLTHITDDTEINDESLEFEDDGSLDMEDGANVSSSFVVEKE